VIFNLPVIEEQHNLKITGVIHVGAFVGEELAHYRRMGLTNTILFEPQNHLYEIISSKCINDEKVFQVALGSHAHTCDMFISETEGGLVNGSGASSSILAPKKHLIEHPAITFSKTETIQVEPLDEFLASKNIRALPYNFLNVDVQGYELEVLKGASKTLGCIHMMVIEVNRDEMYKNCPMINEIDEFLESYGFERVRTYWQSESWGDALYVKR
tara:strand:- start:1260 stop:1901 length:642 start_codon:yes stop_codon:yes gene_type:complete